MPPRYRLARTWPEHHPAGDYSEGVETAEILISRFGPVLAAAVEPSTPRTSASPAASGNAAAEASAVALHAEVLHQMCTADGLLELLDWSRQGLGADPLACMWLGSLRWYRLITGSYPEQAPQPPARRLDQQLQQLRGQRRLTVRHGSGAISLRGLSQGQMSYPSAPAQPETTDDTALLRAVPIGLVPYIDASVRSTWTRQALSLTHGHPDLLEKAAALADLVHRLATDAAAPESPETSERERRAITAGLDDDVAAILERQLLAAAGMDAGAAPSAAAPSSGASTGGASTSAGSPLGRHDRVTDPATPDVYSVIGELARDWEEVTRAR